MEMQIPRITAGGCLSPSPVVSRGAEAVLPEEGGSKSVSRNWVNGRPTSSRNNETATLHCGDGDDPGRRRGACIDALGLNGVYGRLSIGPASRPFDGASLGNKESDLLASS